MTADQPADPVAPCLHTILRKRGVGSDGGITVEAWDCPDCGVILLDRLAPAPQVEPLRAALVNGLAYALARADLPSNIETSRGYAERLAPLIVESGFLLASPPTAQPESPDLCGNDEWDSRYACVKPKGHALDGPGLTSHDYRVKHGSLAARIEAMSDEEFEQFGKALDRVAADKVKRIRAASPPSEASRAVELLRELADEVGRETISGNKRVHMGAWLRARNFLDSLKESGAIPASGEGDE